MTGTVLSMLSTLAFCVPHSQLTASQELLKQNGAGHKTVVKADRMETFQVSSH